MSIKAMEWARKVSDVDATAKFVLMILAGYHNGKTGQCNPSMATLAASCIMTEPTTKSAVRRLEAAGHIDAIGSKKGGRAKSIHWALTGPGLVRFKTVKGVENHTPFDGAKGYVDETPLALADMTPKGVGKTTPDKGKRNKEEKKDPSQRLRLVGVAA